MAKLTDDAMLAELSGGLYGKIAQIDFILRAGYLSSRTAGALVGAKLGLIEVTRRLQTALEEEPLLAARREVLEETGLSLPDQQLCGVWHDRFNSQEG